MTIETADLHEFYIHYGDEVMRRIVAERRVRELEAELAKTKAEQEK